MRHRRTALLFSDGITFICQPSGMFRVRHNSASPAPSRLALRAIGQHDGHSPVRHFEHSYKRHPELVEGSPMSSTVTPREAHITDSKGPLCSHLFVQKKRYRERVFPIAPYGSNAYLLPEEFLLEGGDEHGGFAVRGLFAIALGRHVYLEFRLGARRAGADPIARGQRVVHDLTAG